MKKNILKMFGIANLFFAIMILTVSFAVKCFAVDPGFAIYPEMVFGLYGTSLVIGSSTVFYITSKINSFPKYVIHLILCDTAFALLFSLVNKLEGKTVLVAIALISVVHALCFVVGTVLSRAARKPEEYKSVYKKEK